MSVLFFRNCPCPLLLKIRRLMKRPKLVNAMMLCQCLLPATVLSSAQGTNCKQPSANFVPCQQCMHDSVNVRHIIITMYLHLLINKIFLFLFLFLLPFLAKNELFLAKLAEESFKIVEGMIGFIASLA